MSWKWALALAVISLEGNETREQFFTTIYETGGQWGLNEQGKGYSGSGSKLEYAFPYIRFLENFIKTHDVKTIVDAGCGDWTFSKHVDFGDAEYIGYDVVKTVIDSNKTTFVSPKITFVHGDVVDTDLPAADLLICKDVLQHLSNADVALFLKQLPKFKHCLITNDVDSRTLSSANFDISGDYHNIDLTVAPFNVKGEKIFTYRSQYVIKQVLYIKQN